MIKNIARFFIAKMFIRYAFATAIVFSLIFATDTIAMAGSATLSWTPPTTNSDGTALTNLGGYKVYYGTTSHTYGTSIDVGLSVGNPPSYIVNNLGTGTYYFAVTAYNSTGQESGFSNEGSKIFTPLGPVISSINSGNITTSTALITWTTSIAANSQVEYGTTTSYGSLSTLDANLVTAHSQTLSGLLAGTLYHFRVKSADGAGNLTVSVDNTFTTTSTTPPVISSITANSITTSGAAISWTTNIAANSQVEYGTTTSYGSLSTLNSSLVTSHSQSISALQAGTLYHFRVKSTDGAGNLAVSADNTFTTTSTTPPVISSITANSITTSGAAISWTTNIAANSQVEYGTTASYGSLSSLNSSLVTSHSQSLSALQAGTLYHFRVRSTDGAGNLALSGDNTFTTLSNTVTAPVISAVASGNITSSGATITWTTNIPANSQVEYGIATSYGSLSTLDSSLVNGHSQSLSALQAGTLYHFRVKSADGAGNLSVSADNVFTTSADAGTGGGPTPPPTGSGGTPSPTSITPQQTPVAGGCGMIAPKDGTSSKPGQATDMLAIIGLMFLAIIRKMKRLTNARELNIEIPFNC